MSFIISVIINALPGITPTVRPYSMGRWPQGRMVMRNGKTHRWGLASKPNGDTMELAWLNITYAQAEQICSVWDKNYGVYGMVANTPNPLPAQLLAGTTGGLNSLMAQPFAGASWHIASAPIVEAVKARRCTVRMRISTRAFTGYQ